MTTVHVRPCSCGVALGFALVPPLGMGPAAPLLGDVRLSNGRASGWVGVNAQDVARRGDAAPCVHLSRTRRTTRVQSGRAAGAGAVAHAGDDALPVRA